jgi:hypothetical protein
MKNYYVIYNSYRKPGVEHKIIQALNKKDARQKFLTMNIKHDSIIKIVL